MKIVIPSPHDLWQLEGKLYHQREVEISCGAETVEIVFCKSPRNGWGYTLNGRVQDPVGGKRDAVQDALTQAQGLLETCL
jgi:hypothetical protein